MADGNITVEVSTQAAQAELERLRAENAALKRDLQYARGGLTKGRTRMREDNERLAREAHTWSKAAENYAADAERFRWLAEHTVATGLARWVHPFQFLAEAVDKRRKEAATNAAPRVTTAAELRQQAKSDMSCVGAFARARPGKA